MVAEAELSTKPLIKVARWLKCSQFWVLPGVCILCKADSLRQLDLCHGCEQTLLKIPHPCRQCGLALPKDSPEAAVCGTCLNSGYGLDKAVIPFAWSAPLTALISNFKYHTQLANGSVLAQLLASAIEGPYQQDAMPELLIPIALHPSRLRERGFNQAQLITRKLSQHLDLPMNSTLLQRIMPTVPQQGLNATMRKQNVKKAFVCDAAGASKLKHLRRIAIIDDVVTTASTAAAATKAVRRALPNLEEVHLWALARA